MFQYALALVFLVTCCLAQEPQRPYIPATFIAEYSAEEIYFDPQGRLVENQGRGWRAYDFEGQRDVHNTTYYTESGQEVHYTLDLYHIDKSFSIHGPVFHHTCTNVDLFGDFNSYFDWLNFAQYKGRYDHEGEELDFWYVEVGADVHEVGVRPYDTSIPVVYYHHHDYESRTTKDIYTFFRAEKPDDVLFKIPDSCEEKVGQTSQRPNLLRHSERLDHLIRRRRGN